MRYFSGESGNPGNHFKAEVRHISMGGKMDHPGHYFVGFKVI